MMDAKLFARAILAGLLVQTAVASKPLKADGRLGIYGDFRFRTDYDWDAVEKDGRTPKNDRLRTRARIRLGLKGKVAARWTFDTRVRNADPDDVRFSHVTLWQNDGSKRIRSDVTIDRAKFEYADDAFKLAIGRDDVALWGPTELRDTNRAYFDGAHARWVEDGRFGRWTVFAMGGGAPMGGDHLGFGDRTALAAAQVGHSKSWGKSPLKLSNSMSFVYDEKPLAISIDSADFLVYSATLEKSWRWGDAPVRIGGAFFKNFDQDDQLREAGEQDEGLALFTECGSSKEVGGSVVRVAWARMERWAIDYKLAFDSWFLFDGASRVTAIDYEGLELQYGYRIAKDINMLARVAKIRALADGQKGKRLRVDMNVSF